MDGTIPHWHSEFSKGFVFKNDNSFCNYLTSEC